MSGRLLWSSLRSSSWHGVKMPGSKVGCAFQSSGAQKRVQTKGGGTAITYKKGFYISLCPTPVCVSGQSGSDEKRTGHVVNSTSILSNLNLTIHDPVRVTQTIPLVGLQSYASNTRVSRCQCPTFRRLSPGRFLRRVRSVGHNGRTCWTFLKRVLSTPCVPELLNSPTPSAHGLSLKYFRYLT